MIASIRGEVLDIGSDSLVIGIGGIGLSVHVTANVRDRAQLGDIISLHTQLIMREDLLALYGFEQVEGREFFNLLLGVNGIGPRTALMVLSVLSIDAIRRAIVSEQPDVFARVPGIGKRTAQKIILHLQGKIRGETGPLEGLAQITDIEAEVIGALTALGYSVVEAQAAVQAIPKDAPPDVETRLRMALQYFST